VSDHSEREKPTNPSAAERRRERAAAALRANLRRRKQQKELREQGESPDGDDIDASPVTSS
jgi:hypothetical protein